ncbi:hypothetical protein [Herbidospora daliensis]|uniref:hypothetical protein n=1 Tax=Herbidospora daliensis TaxID=295585 RepID=UPI0012F9F61D|nr:hypothetical protein [Herbidospora daliensis]
MGDEVRTTKTQGYYVRRRREALGLSQDSAAWLARVAKTTFRNIEGDKVEEARTWPQVERALGWRPGSEDMIKMGLEPRSVLSDSVLRSIVKVVLRYQEIATLIRQECSIAERRLNELHAERGRVSTEPDADQEAISRIEYEIERSEKYIHERERTLELRDYNAFHLQSMYSGFLYGLADGTLAPALTTHEFATLMARAMQPGEFESLVTDVINITGMDIRGFLDEDVLQDLPANLRNGVQRVERLPHLMRPPASPVENRLVLSLAVPGAENLDESDVQFIAAQVTEVATAIAKAFVRAKASGATQIQMGETKRG